MSQGKKWKKGKPEDEKNLKAEESGFENEETGKTEEAGETAFAEEKYGAEPETETEDAVEPSESEKVKELQDRYQRLLAEFDNFRKRTEKEKSSMYENGLSKGLEKILPVLDNFERGLAAIPEENRDDPNYVGMDQIYKQLVKSLEELGVKPMDAQGKEFDPNFHNAVMQVESEDYPENTVVAELQKGYLLHDHVLRHAMVSVSK